MKVHVAYTRTRKTSGCAYLNSRWMTLRIAKHGDPDKVGFAHTVYHELAHTRGLTHERMHNKAYGYADGWREHYAWATSMPLERVEKKSKVTPPNAKLAHAQKMLKSALTREKRATTLRKKWDAKVKYYTKRTKGETRATTEV